ncbi:MAG TPA: ion transporter [Prolixibacteraceae bacterium]|nr:ion transporter [Prolixibacteraceae bacterium]
MMRISDFSRYIIDKKAFKGFILFLILFSAVLIGMETYSGFASRYRNLLQLLDQIIILCFVVEITLKILAEGKKPWNYFRDPWNVFDFVVVAVCLLPLSDTHYFAVLRVLRVMRILRMITFLPRLRLIVGALLKSIPSMGYVILLITILFFVYAVLGVFVFGSSDPTHFGDLHHAMITLFQIFTLEGWTDIMNIQIYGSADKEGMQIVSLWPFLYFASFILIAAVIIMNLFIGIIMNSMEESQKELAMELQELADTDKTTEDQITRLLDRIDELKEEILLLKKIKK